ncbi:hypothetical protein LARV_03294 [Longilinea arvoryzae]|uniref:GH16 domain-containing protein n=1 Tax=Longilinea arvoryzae TaxID=360412 RepID=A0A0S7BNF8_9CHLR|nr:hypothetical protein [Longilinea arvoryzae]GAP15505.1 hypothetical protein LARV_03294 [Longilinea arvoryzae]
MIPNLQSRISPDGEVEPQGDGNWTLRLRAGTERRYRWAQVDDYIPLARRDFRWRAPLRLRLRARAFEPSAAGTWGFGLWNDPFAFNLLGGTARRLPVLPNAAWFFYSLPPNYLTLRDGTPGHGFVAQTFAAPRIPAILLAPAGLGLPLLAWRRAARALRRMARRVIREDSARIHVDVTQWHTYELDWLTGEARFRVDGRECLATPVSPRGPLGLVVWIDNQYMAFPPDGRLRMGVLPVPRDAALELREIRVEPESA